MDGLAGDDIIGILGGSVGVSVQSDDVLGGEGNDTLSVSGGVITRGLGSDLGNDSISVLGGTINLDVQGDGGNDAISVSGGTINRSVFGDRGEDNSGTDTVVLRGTSTHSGAVALNGGTLQLDGTLTTTGLTMAADTGLDITASGQLNLGSSTTFGGDANNNGAIDATGYAPMFEGMLTGDGSVIATDIDLSSGTVAPGNSIGNQMFFGDTMLGNLEIEFADQTTFDTITINGELDFGVGTVISLFGFPGDVMLTDGTFDIISFTSLAVGALSNVSVDGTGINPGDWTITEFSNMLRLTFTGGTATLSAVPEPGAVGLMATGLGLLIGWKR